MSQHDGISDAQASYYGKLFQDHGPGVDAVASGKQIYKDLRYAQLCRVFGDDSAFSLHDVGFGLCHLYEYVKTRFPDRSIMYSGSEVTPAFIEMARDRYRECEFQLRDIATTACKERYDYIVLGGTFYHLAGADAKSYEEYVKTILSNAFAMCSRGLVFNLITGFVGYRHENLFYGELADMLPFVVRNLSRFFTVQHNYPLFEYTLCVYTSPQVSRQYPDSAFDKYFDERRPKDP